MKNNFMTIGIVGTGRFGNVLEKLFARDGFEVLVSSRSKVVDGKKIESDFWVIFSEFTKQSDNT